MVLQKTRVIPISDFYTRLQLEYICYKFRSLIYQRVYDKKKFEDICQKKREKIDQIAFENCLPSIFNNEVQREKYLKKFFGEWGLPNFTYRDEYQQRVKGYWDIYYYFIQGSSVRLHLEKDIEIGKIISCDIKDQLITIQVEDKEVNKSFSDVSRIFPSDFFPSLFK
jgi:hypothetical protein